MNTHFCLLHSFPRTLSVQWRFEWCFSLFLLSASEPWSGSSLLCVCPSSRPQGSRCFAKGFKGRPDATEEFKSCRTSCTFLSPFIFSRGSIYTHCFLQFKLFGTSAVKGKAGGSGRAELGASSFHSTSGKCPGCMELLNS